MSSGKQLSFGYGEISPLLHYKSDGSFFTAGLKQALNGIVRSTGGISNRQGTLVIPVDPAASTQWSDDSRLFSFAESTTKEQLVIVFNKEIPAPDPAEPFPQRMKPPFQVFRLDGSEIPVSSAEGVHEFPVAGGGITVDTDSLSFRYIKGEVVMTFKILTGNPFLTHMTLVLKSGFSFEMAAIPTISTQVGAPANTTLGQAGSHYLVDGVYPQPVCYYVYQELFDGSEFPWQSAYYVSGMPSSSATTQIDGLSLDDSSSIKQYNIYRAAGAVNGGTYNPDNGAIVGGTPTRASAYGLVSRIPADEEVTKFGDSLITPDMTVTPPSDLTLDIDYRFQAEKIFYANERYMVVPKAGIFDNATMVASKLGSRFFFRRGLAPTQVDAFNFNLDSDHADIGEIRDMADLDDSIIVTSDAAYAVRGMEGGVISYANVNPSRVHGEGIAKNSNLVNSANLVFYLASDRSKIISLRTSENSQSSYIPDNVSVLSSHLFKQRNIKRLAMVKGDDTIIWALDSRGKMLSVTYDASSGVRGFARHETEGFVIDIATTKAESDPLGYSDFASVQADTTAMLVRRQGGVYLEVMPLRDDTEVHNMIFADGAVRLGKGINPGDLYLILSTTTDYLAGTELTLQDLNESGYFGDHNDEFIDIKRNNDTNEYLRLRKVADVDANTITVVCDYDIPVDLQSTFIYQYRIPVKEVGPLPFSLWGKKVSIFMDGMVIASPLNKMDMYEEFTVSDMTGMLDLKDYYREGYVGLPYRFLAETLPLEASDNRTFTDKGKLINSIGVALDSTIGGLSSQSPNPEFTVDGVTTLLYPRDSNMVSNPGPESRLINQVIPAEWSEEGSVSIHQIDPLPITVAAIYPKGVIGG